MKWNSLKAKTQHTAKAERIDHQNLISFLKTFQTDPCSRITTRFLFRSWNSWQSYQLLMYFRLCRTSILIRHYPASAHHTTPGWGTKWQNEGFQHLAAFVYNIWAKEVRSQALSEHQTLSLGTARQLWETSKSLRVERKQVLTICFCFSGFTEKLPSTC